MPRSGSKFTILFWLGRPGRNSLTLAVGEGRPQILHNNLLPKVQYKIPCGYKLQCINTLHCPGERETRVQQKMAMCDDSTLILVVLTRYSLYYACVVFQRLPYMISYVKWTVGCFHILRGHMGMCWDVLLDMAKCFQIVSGRQGICFQMLNRQ